MKVTKKRDGCCDSARGAMALAILLLSLVGRAAWAEEGDFSKARVGFALGQDAFVDGRLEESARLFEQAAGHDPGHGDSLHWLGLAYLRLGRPADAVIRLEESLQARELPTAGRRRVRSDLRLARDASEKGSTAPILVEPPPYNPAIPLFEALPRWESRVGMEALHDSNPGLLPEDLLFPLPGHPDLKGASADEAARLDLRLEHHPFYSRGWNLGLALTGQHSMYQDQGDLDLSLYRGTASLSWGGSRTGTVSGPLGSTRVPTAFNPISLLLQGGGAWIRVGGDSYLGLAEGALSLTARETRWTASRLDLEARHSSYEEDGPGALRRGGTEVLVGASQSLFLGREDRTLRLGIVAGEREAGRAFDSSSGEVLAEVSVPLAEDWTVQALGSWRKDRFDHAESSLATGGSERDDTTWRMAVGASFSMNAHLRWTVRGSHVQRDSNVQVGLGTPLLDYERTILSLGFAWRP
jgi:hypothetical protein